MGFIFNAEMFQRLVLLEKHPDGFWLIPGPDSLKYFISVQNFSSWGSLGIRRMEMFEENRFIVKSYFCWMLTQGFFIFPDSVYVTVLDGRERNVSKKMCSAVNSHFQQKKMNFSLSNSPLPLSDAVK